MTCLNANYTDSGLFGFVAAALPENMDKVCSHDHDYLIYTGQSLYNAMFAVSRTGPCYK